MIDLKEFESMLKKVEKPARYIGMELNAVNPTKKNPTVRFVFSYPDVYEVGMSHLGMHIIYNLINDEQNFLCERAFAPWHDLEKLMREKKMPLFSLESKTPVKEFDMWGFTLQYEMSYTNILNMLDLAEIPIFAAERDESFPLIVAGGPCAYNPEPLWKFIDFFILGEAEEVNLEVLRLYERHKLRGYQKQEFLEAVAQIEGVYVPAFYEEQYHEDGTVKGRIIKNSVAPSKVKRRYVRNIEKMYAPEKMLVSYIETVHDRVSMELFRGCTHGCRFCQAGMIYRPVREKHADSIVARAEKLVENTGYENVSLSSLSSCDYSDLTYLVKNLMESFQEKKVGISLPSLRLDTFSINVLKEIEKVRKTGLTFAPEAGTQRLRDVINKGVTEEHLINTINYVFQEGWNSVKLYFMIGLPTETREDVLGIKELSYKVKDLFFAMPKEKRQGNLKITASASCFVPKPWTPFQWVAQNSAEEFLEKAQLLKREIRDSKVSFSYHDPYVGKMEGALARGDRKIADVIYRAWKKGCIFDGWRDFFDCEKWMTAFEEAGVDPNFYSSRQRAETEIFPWDFIDIEVTKSFLLREYQKSMRAETSPDCRHQCRGCGIIDCPMRRNEDVTAS